ncbi:MAG: hypothetical protein NC818_07380 [Candidatus Omnitrophica bacterium]|nr:hypothetical protein [Candidatus Omnitrophota bacterium]
MPKIPIYESRLDLTEEAPAPRLTSTPPAVTVSQALGEMGEVLTEIGLKFRKADVARQLAQAELSLRRQLEQLELEALTDNNEYDEEEFNQQYISKLSGIKQAELKKLTYPEAKNEFLNLFDRYSISSEINLKKIHRQKIIDLGRGAFEALETDLISSYARIDDQKAKEVYKDQIIKEINKAYETGFLKPQEKKEKLTKLDYNLQKAQIYYDILYKPEEALQELQKGTVGFFNKISEKERMEFIDEIRTRLDRIKRENKQAIAVAQNQNELEDLKRFWAGELTVEEVKRQIEEGKIGRPFGLSLIKNLQNPVRKERPLIEQLTKYNELVERKNELLGKGGSFDKITRYRADALKAVQEGYITESQFKDLFSDTADIAFKNKEFRNALKKSKLFSSSYTTPEEQVKVKAELYGNVLQKVITGKKPQEALIEAINEKLEEDIYAAGDTKNFLQDKRIVKKINELRAQGKSDKEIAVFLRKAGYNPKFYDIKE